VKSVLPNGVLVEHAISKSFAVEDLGVHADDQHLLVIGSVEDANPSQFRQVTGGPPQKIVLQFRRAGVFVAVYLTALRIDPEHHVLDCAVFPGCVHRLENQETGIAIGCV
jgi:hypothetical protein